jgi:soluble lytic murein transglycosylase
MPATGKGIANVLEVDGYSVDDLFRPSISVEFAAYYLALQLSRFDDQLLVALAAYNGGPGNTLKWLELGGEDLDLFVERITATQSRLYLQRVYEHYIQYEDLYRSAGDGP